MRYSRQTLYRKIGKAGQKKLEIKKVCIIGLGGLGTVTSELIGRAGIGTLILIDNDIVEESNLQRQSLFDEEDIGKSKALTAEEKLKKINSKLEIISYNMRLTNKNTQLLDSDLVLDCSDNLESRFLINKHCIEKKIPWIFLGKF